MNTNMTYRNLIQPPEATMVSLYFPNSQHIDLLYLPGKPRPWKQVR